MTKKHRFLAITALALVVAASGCVESDLATEDDVEQVAEEVHRADSPSYKYNIKEIEVSAECEENERLESETSWIYGNASITDWQTDELQEFHNGKYFVKNEFSVEDTEINVDCGSNYVEGFRLDRVIFQKTTFKDGAEIDSREKSCGIYHYFDTEDRSIYESGSWEIDVYDEYNRLSEVKSKIYEQCLRID